MKKKLLLLIGCFTALFSYGQFISYPFSGLSNCPISSSSFNFTYGTATFPVRSSGLTCVQGTTGFISTGWSTATNIITTPRYIEFSITPSANNPIILSSLTFSHYRSANGPTKFMAAHNASGNFDTYSQEYTVNESETSSTFDFPDISCEPGKTITFRIFGYSTPSVQYPGSARFLSISFNGAAASVYSVFQLDYVNKRAGLGALNTGSKLSLYDTGSSVNQWRGRLDAGGDSAMILFGEYAGKANISSKKSNFNTPTDLVINVDTGNVGIGTNNPTEKLSVNGNIKTKKLIVTQVGWADYVFAPTYRLMALQDLETYIKLHQHLPEIPSASDVALKGVDLGDNQTFLLKKIEELTLYLIEQNKEIKKLKRELKTLKQSGVSTVNK